MKEICEILRIDGSFTSNCMESERQDDAYCKYFNNLKPFALLISMSLTEHLNYFHYLTNTKHENESLQEIVD